jgi:ABC-type multidrug transport system permease subunit
VEIIIDKYYNRKRLQTWLEFEIGGSALLFLHYFAFPFNFIIPRFISIMITGVVVLALIFFVILIFKVLLQEKRYGWIKLFFVFVAGSGLITYLFLIRQIGCLISVS